MQRIKTLRNYLRDGINNGLIAGAVIVFLILIGLPAALPGREPLAPISIPLFTIICVVFGVVLVRQNYQRDSWRKLIANGAAMGVAVAIVFSLFMGLINRWQANPNINVQQYFYEVNLKTTERLSGVPTSELFANPPIDRTTQELPEDAVLRTNPMRLIVNDDDVYVVNLGLVKLGGIYGTALFFALISLLSVPVYRALLLVDWEEVRERRAEIAQRPRIAETTHWFKLLLPILLFVLFVATVPMNYNVTFWRGVLGEDAIEKMHGRDITEDTIVNSALLDLGEVFDMSGRATQNLQIIIAFTIIIAFMVALRDVRYKSYAIGYPIRMLIFGVLLVLLMVLVVWRVQGSGVIFISPTLDFLPDDSTQMSLILVFLITGGLAIYAILNSVDSYNFESTLLGVTGAGMTLALPLFMDQYQTSVMNIVAINAMLGLGLNIVVGYAGLLDLGYVAFFAIGAYSYALVESNRRRLEISDANHLFFSVLTALIIVPLVVFGTAYLWQNMQKNKVRAAANADGIKHMKPLWADSPPWYISLGLVVFAVVVALLSKEILEAMGAFDGTYRASPFLVGLMIAVVASAFAGFMLGFPVLRLRSDYLAIVTLGFGEIISIALESPDLESYTGGAFGADALPRPLPSDASISEANLAILYLAMLGCVLVAFVSMRLRHSRLGRSWTAVRSDEDIAQAMGINLVNSKLLAFAIGASFAGIGGLLFGARQVNIRPPNFNLNVSINVLALVIIGGMGSIPGVIIGAIVLVGLPEVLRALAEYRILAFGALLVVMMLVRPQGLMPQPLTGLEERARQLRAKRQAVEHTPKGRT